MFELSNDIETDGIVFFFSLQVEVRRKANTLLRQLKTCWKHCRSHSLKVSELFDISFPNSTVELLSACDLFTKCLVLFEF